MTDPLITAGVFLFIYWLIFAITNAWSNTIDNVIHRMRDEIGTCYLLECNISEGIIDGIAEIKERQAKQIKMNAGRVPYNRNINNHSKMPPELENIECA